MQIKSAESLLKRNWMKLMLGLNILLKNPMDALLMKAETSLSVVLDEVGMFSDLECILGVMRLILDHMT
jgi:hypothetical protein